ncbi:hypothetical protein JCM10450v2_003607 [Rhodotorula kratochvilovae]
MAEQGRRTSSRAAHGTTRARSARGDASLDLASSARLDSHAAKGNHATQERSYLLPPPTQRLRPSPRPSSSSRSSSRASNTSTLLTASFPPSFRGGEGFFSHSKPKSMRSSSPTPANEPASKRLKPLPVGVPRPPTARSSRKSSAAALPAASGSTSSTRSRTLTATQPRSPASSQELIEPEARTPRAKRTTTPSPSPPPEPPVPKPAKRPRRSTTPTGEPPAGAAFVLPPPSQARAAPAVPPQRKTLGPVPQLPPSCFRPAAPAPLQPPAPAPTATSLPPASLPQKRPRPRAPSPAAADAEPLPARLLNTDFAPLDPSSHYALRSSLLFRAEYLARGPPTYEQGGKRGYGAAVPAKKAPSRAQGWEVPAWARTEDGREWEEDVLRRLAARISAPPAPGAGGAGEELIPLLFGADVDRLRATRLGEGGGMECYLLGREWPVRTGVWTGWVVSGEWREREGAWVYADIITDPNAVPMHHRLVAALHASVYAAPFDARARLAAIERAEAEAKQRAWEAGSAVGSSAAGSEWGGTRSEASSPGRGVHYRPTRPAKLAPEDLTLSNFLTYIRHHLLKRYVRALAPSPAASPSSSSPGFPAAREEHNEETLPFTLPALQANAHLSLFAARLAQERARTKAPAKKSARAWVAPPPGGAHRPARGSVRAGAARLLLPPPSSGSRARREEKQRERVGEEEPLRGAELDKAVGRVWREAIRTMRRNGMIVEAEEAEGSLFPVTAGRADLPDLPQHPRAGAPHTPVKKRGDAPWGAAVIPSSAASRVGEATPRTRKPKTAPAFGCPWGDVKLYGDDDDVGGEQSEVFKTPRAARRAAPPPPPPQPAPARFPSSPAAPSSPARSDCSILTTGSLDPRADGDVQAFQLVTPRSLAPLVLSLVTAAYATGKGSVTEQDVRQRMHVDERWAAVAQFSEAVGKALGVLADQGRVERHGKGWRPVRKWA